VGIVSLFKPEWRFVSAFASGLYYGVAAVQHGLKNFLASMKNLPCVLM